MAYDLSGVDVYFLSKELQALEGAKVDKIVQIDKKLFTIRFFGSKQKTTLRILVPDMVNITSRKYDSPKAPYAFCSFLRKYLQNTKLTKVSQKSFERILLFEFSTLKYGDLVLILELFKPGNMILCKKEEGNLVILNALERQEFKSRKVAAREIYEFPPEQNNPVSMSEDKLLELSKASGKTLGKLLATDLSLGGTFAQEIIAGSGLDKDKTELSGENLREVIGALKSFFSQEAKCVSAKGKIYPVAMKSITTDSVCGSFNEGLDTIEVYIEEEGKEIKKTSKKSTKSKTAALLDIQEKRIAGLEREIYESQKIGEFIYEHYQDFQKLIDAVKKLRSEKKTYEDIEKILSENKHFRKLDSAKKIVVMSWNEGKQENKK